MQTNIEERLMRGYSAIVAAIFISGCATVPATTPAGKVAVYDHKYNVTTYVDRPAESEFVGTSAKPQTTA
jgi:PBP1b-binding outer membrane lipoprotein LpoB